MRDELAGQVREQAAPRQTNRLTVLKSDSPRTTEPPDHPPTPPRLKPHAEPQEKRPALLHRPLPILGSNQDSPDPEGPGEAD